MNILLHELRYYKKQALYWSIGIVLLLIVSFYKVNGMYQSPGGVETVLKALPSFLQTFFGMGRYDYTSGLGGYHMIHMYLSIALALHAGALGAHLFAKEQLDHTCEFLYVKGRSRCRIFISKSVAGMFLLLLLDVVCYFGVQFATTWLGFSISPSELLPYLVMLFLLQLFFFTLALWVSLFLSNVQKAGMMATSIIFTMFLLTMYTKMGGSVGYFEKFSIFYYSDASYIQRYGYGGSSTLMLIILILCIYGISMVCHEHRNLT